MFIVIAVQAVALLALLAFRSNAQTIEKLELVLGPPVYNTNRGDGLAYEARGNVYAKNTPFECLALGPEAQAEASKTRLGTYRIAVSTGNPAEHIATYSVRLSDGRNLIWWAYIKIDPDENGSEFSWTYEGIILRSTQTILTDFTPLSRNCFGGKLTVFFLN